MKRIFIISTICLFSLQCEKGWLREILNPTTIGCTSIYACNYNIDANEDDGSCDYHACTDCLGYPYGVAVLDSCGTCDASTLNDCTQDCSDTWGGTATTDNCGNCSTSNIACELDCNGVWDGSSEVDACDVCGGSAISLNDCTDCHLGLSLGCDGNCSATPAVEDECGVCDGIDGYVAGFCYDCADVPFGTAQLDNCGVCDTDLTNDCPQDCEGVWGGDALNCGQPELFADNQSTLQAFYFFLSVTINNVPVEVNDWVGAFNGDVCVGASKWDTSQCGEDVCDLPVMGDDGNPKTEGYMLSGEVPTFKIYDASDGEYYDATPSEEIPWSINGFNVIALLHATTNP